jgi:hypothetical protein
MRYIQILTETTLPLDGIDLSSFQNFLNSLKRVPREQVSELQKILTDMQRKLRQPHEGYAELYHGTPNNIADIIIKNGFRLTQGRRGGFMGLTNHVDNQGIFLTDQKSLAHYFGSNRSDGHPGDYRLITCYTDISHVLRIDQAPRPIIRFGLKMINDYNGTNVRKIAQQQWWWLLDQKPFVDALKAAGYTGAKFQEAAPIRRASQSPDAHTFLIFDPTTIKIAELTKITIEDFYKWLTTQPHDQAVAA